MSHADDVRSAILNCICPECGGVIELETSELKLPGTMWQALVGYLGANTTASPSKEGETIFIAKTNDWAR